MGLSWGDSGLTLLCHGNHHYQKPFPEAERLVLPTNANTVPHGLYHGLLFCWTLLGKHSFAGTQEGKFWYYLMEGLDLNWGQFFQDTSFVCLCVVENAITAWSSSSSGSSELWTPGSLCYFCGPTFWRLVFICSEHLHCSRHCANTAGIGTSGRYTIDWQFIFYMLRVHESSNILINAMKQGVETRWYF